MFIKTDSEYNKALEEFMVLQGQEKFTEQEYERMEELEYAMGNYEDAQLAEMEWHADQFYNGGDDYVSD